MDLILASNSPRRRELLANMGLSFQAVSPETDERVAGRPSPGRLVTALSERKARAVAALEPDSLVIAADTVVYLDGRILGKPKTREDAFSMLRALSGRRHRVYTGVTVLLGGQARTEYERTVVTFRPLEDAEIWNYIATGEPMDKAGAYGIQGYGAMLVSRISGDYFNVMGLPVARLRGMLAACGVDCLRLASGAEERKP